MDRPEALRLADVGRLSRHDKWHRQTDAELRRLHTQRDALLHALRWIDKRCPLSLMEHELHAIHREMAHDAGACARAAIAKAEGEKT